MILGIDLGGTNIAMGVVDNGEIVFKREVPVNKTSKDALISQLRDEISAVKEKYDIKKVGIGIPGMVDHRRNYIYRCVNVPLVDVDLERELKDLNVELFIGNDATVACVAEFGFGKLKGVNDGLLITLGTGIGGGAIVDGKVLYGHNGQALEPGHAVIVKNGRKCTCSRNGCFEAYASASRFLEIYNEKSQNKATSAKEIFDRHLEGDELATESISELTDYIAVGLANLALIFNPQKIILTGGMSKAWPIIKDQLLEKLSNEIIYPKEFHPEVDVSLIDNPGILGASYLCEI